MTARTLPESIRAFAAEALTVAALLEAATEIQWKPSLTPKPREDTSERARGGHGDPTLDTVLDSRRLAVRAAVISAETAFDGALDTLREVRPQLERAIDAWNGN